MTSTFTNLGIRPELIAALGRLGITSPTPIQEAAIPLLLDRKNAYLQAETGTGKTLAYLLPIYSTVDPTVPNAQTIILAPTHELALQIQRQCTDLAQHSGIPIRVLLLIGGTSRDRQLEKLKKKPHVIVGSPGRILELIEDGKLKVHQVKSIVIDEADRLLVSEHLSALRSIIKSTLKDRALYLVSATEHVETGAIIDELSPTIVRVRAGSTPINPSIDHFHLLCEERDKPEVVRKLIHAIKPERALVFVHRNEDAEILAEKLAHHKLRVADLHGARTKEERKRSMDSIRAGNIDVLICSDVAARGLDIKGVTLVVNLDVPSESDAYLHRVGRTGRAGADGMAVSLMSGPQARLVSRFEKQLGISIPQIYLRDGRIHLAKDVASHNPTPQNDI